MMLNPAEPADSTRKTPRLYWRNQKGAVRAYADLRSLGGGRPALIPPGENRATTDPEIAEKLLLQRVRELQERKKKHVLFAIDLDPDLANFAIHHLEEKERSGEYHEGWLNTTVTYLARAVAYFTRYQHATTRNPEPQPRPRSLATIGVEDVRAFQEWLKTQPNQRGGQLSPQSRRHHLSALSGVFKRAISEGKLPVGTNPVAALMDKPIPPSSETAWLDVDELALLLESARTYVSEMRAAWREPLLPCVYELLATFVLTGAREGEIRQMQISHLDFDSRTIAMPGDGSL